MREECLTFKTVLSEVMLELPFLLFFEPRPISGFIDSGEASARVSIIEKLQISCLFFLGCSNKHVRDIQNMKY